MPKQPWEGVYNATYFRPSCMQDPNLLFGEASEDCLQLNIYAPQGQVEGGRPVMVWIFGGGNVAGSATLPNYYGQPLAATGDVIVVTINYRLNIFGFLTTSDAVLPGNLGMRDQVMALQWIRQNIAAFGGNPERVTLFGQSSGASSVGFHMLSDMSTGLFSQVISQSGTVFSPLATPDIPEYLRGQAFTLGAKMGCATEESAALVECLREAPAEALIGALTDEFRAAVVVDGIFLKDRPENLYRSGNYNRGNLLLGSNKDDGTLFLLYDPLFAQYLSSPTRPNITKELFDTILKQELYYFYGLDPNENAHLIDAAKMRYVDWGMADYPNADYYNTYVSYATDSVFTCNDDIVARAHALGGANVYRYQMTHAPTNTFLGLLTNTRWLGAGHAEEILFTFGSPFIPALSYVYQPFTAQEKAFSVKMMRFWTNFARTGNPSISEPESMPKSPSDAWPRFTIPELEYKVLDLDLSTGRALKSSECYFWNIYIRRLVTLLGELEMTEREWRQSYYNWKYTDLANWREEFARYKASRQ
jgi:carboxylesterase type B